MPDPDDAEALLRRVLDVPAGATVELTYDSHRSDDPVTVRGVAMGSNHLLVREVPLYLRTDDSRGDVFVSDARNHMGELIELDVRSMRGPRPRSTSRLGLLLDLEVVEDG